MAPWGQAAKIKARPAFAPARLEKRAKESMRIRAPRTCQSPETRTTTDYEGEQKFLIFSF